MDTQFAGIPFDDSLALDGTEDYDVRDSSETPPPPPRGRYEFQILAASWRKEFGSDALKLTQGKYPILVLETLRVRDGDRELTIYPGFQELRSNPYPAEFGRGRGSELQDLLLGFDATVRIHSFEDLDRFVTDQTLQQTAWARGLFDWYAEDRDGIKQKLAELGPGVSQADKNAVYKQGRVKGMRKFPPKAAGSYSHLWTSPFGNEVPARLRLGTVYPANDPNVKLGPAQR